MFNLTLPKWMYIATIDKDKELQEAKDDLSKAKRAEIKLLIKLDNSKKYFGWFPANREYDEKMLGFARRRVVACVLRVNSLEAPRKNTDTDNTGIPSF